MKTRHLVLLVCASAALAACGREQAAPSQAQTQTQTQAPASAPQGLDVPATASIREIMEGFVEPSADFLFSSVQEVSNDQGVSLKQPQTDGDWAEVRRNLTVLAAVPAYLTSPGRAVAPAGAKSEHPGVENEPEVTRRLIDADPANFARRGAALTEAVGAAMKAAEAKDARGLMNSLVGVDHACEACHLQYWYPNDKRAQQAAREEGIVQ